jgi:hypothetical protein
MLQDAQARFAEAYKLEFLDQLDLDTVATFRAAWTEGPRTSLKKLERLRAFMRFAANNVFLLIGLKAMLKARKLLILRIGKMAKHCAFAQARYTTVTPVLHGCVYERGSSENICARYELARPMRPVRRRGHGLLVWSGFRDWLSPWSDRQEDHLFFERDGERRISLLITGNTYPNVLAPYSHFGELEELVRRHVSAAGLPARSERT